MIILLEASNDELSSVKKGDAEDLFSLLLDADRFGRHLVVLPRRVCSWAEENLDLSGRNLKHLVGIRENFSTRGKIPTAAKLHLKVVMGSESISIRDGFFQIGHVEFISGEYAQTKARMVVENLRTDSRLYEYIFGVSVSKTNVPGWAVDFVLGGGDTTATAFEAEIARNRITVCVVDTDRIAPCDRLGQTAKKVLNIHANRNEFPLHPASPYIGIAMETVGHELENYVPMRSVKKLPAFRLPSSLESLISQKERKAPSECLWLYFDIKKGVDGKKISDKVAAGKKDREVIAWLAQKANTVEDDFEGLRISGIGGTIVDHFLECDAAKEEYIEFSRSDYWSHIFLGHFERILWFLAAPTRLRL